MKKKYLESLQMNISNSYWKNGSISCIFNQRNLFNSLIHSSLSSNVHKKQALKCLFKIPLWREINNATFYFLIFLVKIWNENSISIPMHPGIIYFWIRLFGGATYQGVKKVEAGSGALMGNVCLKSHRWYDVEKLAIPSSSNLNLSFSGAQQKFLC